MTHCTYCGLVVVWPVTYATFKCDDYKENGRTVTLPFCTRGHAEMYRTEEECEYEVVNE